MKRRNPNQLYVIVNFVSAELHGIYEDESMAIQDCQTMNTLGSYSVMTLQEHLDNLMTWFNRFDENYL